MAATREDIKRWIITGKKQKSTNIISVCDTFDYNDYPVYCKTEKELNAKIGKYMKGENMQRVNEVIDFIIIFR